jgi:hypothetical protein
MISLQAYLYTYSLLRGINFEVLPVGGFAFCPMMLPMMETFLELLFPPPQYLEIFIPFEQTLLLEPARSHLEPNQGNRVGVPFQQLILRPEAALQCLVSWSMVIVGPKFRPFSRFLCLNLVS